MKKIWENNGTEEIGLVTPTPGPKTHLSDPLLCGHHINGLVQERCICSALAI